MFIYDKWSDRTLPRFVENETVMPTVLELHEGTTTAPPLLTEAELINKMDSNGIGTDATISQHIQTIQVHVKRCSPFANLFVGKNSFHISHICRIEAMQ